MSTINCKNCEHHYKGNFCPTCGQKATEGHIGLKYFLHDIPHSVFHIDKGFFYTLGVLISSPGQALKNYLAGKRVKFFKPFAFVIIMSTICTILIKGIHYLINLRFQILNEGRIINFERFFFEKYISILIFLLIPLLSFITWLCFRKQKYNYWEHFLVNTFLAAYLNVFFLLISMYQLVKYYVTNNFQVNYTLFMFLFMSYYGYAFARLMNSKGNRLQNIFIILLMNFFLATIYMTAFSLTGIMKPWWGE
jgi:Protein of unknown function (DUF3667)